MNILSPLARMFRQDRGSAARPEGAIALLDKSTLARLGCLAASVATTAIIVSAVASLGDTPIAAAPTLLAQQLRASPS